YKANADAEQARDRRLRDTVAMNHPLALPAASYTGKYVNELYCSMTVTQGENNDLEMRFEQHPRMYVNLQPLGGNQFCATFSGPTSGKAIFQFNVPNRRVAGVRLKVADFVEYNPYE